MVALPDFEREFSAPPFSDPVDSPDVKDAGAMLAGGLLRLFSGASIGAALGLWLLPSVAGDPALMLLKLLFSLGLLWAGLLALHATRLPDPRPVVQVDRRNAQLRILQPAGHGAPGRCAVHKLAELSELSLRDGLLSARDQSGQLIVSLEISDKQAARALREALSFAA